MSSVLTPLQGIVFLLVYGLVMIALTAWFGRGHVRDNSEFLLASRRVGVLPGAMSIAASWIWAPALFVAAQKSYQQGAAGLFWFTFPNVLSLVVFAPLALRIRRRLPFGYTLPQYMRVRHGRGVHVLYLIQFFCLQICSIAVQILAGALLVEQITGLGFTTVAVILVATALIYSLMGGVRASVTTDFLQMALILGVMAVVVPWSVYVAGGVSHVAAGLGGTDEGSPFSLFNPWIAYSFGIPVTIGLLSGPIGDQMHWQRAYALRSDRAVVQAFGLGAVLFAIVPLGLSLLGFLAADPAVSSTWQIENVQLIGPIAVEHLLPPAMLVVFSVMLLSGLCSTLDSALCAASALAAVDLHGRMHDGSENEHERGRVIAARIGMFVTAAMGLGIASLPGLSVVHLFLFYGTLRASTMIPTVATLYSERLGRHAVFIAIGASLILGAPLYALGSLRNNVHMSVAGSLLVVVIGIVACGAGVFFFPRDDSGRSSS